ncbi:MAG TPA: nicotinate-nicotinamide nucleotide adenylyltransferase [Nitrospiraceae bacterium]|nr:nicotinate-nicotinamide nucleotide adenylyltransferase [Nitrospiraceae bacterium]
MTKKLGILGGTFNPIHVGHLAAAEEVRERLDLARILFIPSFLPPHKDDEAIPPAAQRLAMVKIAIAGNPQFSLSDIEVQRGGKSYTVDTVTDLHRAYPGAEFFFITGLDSFLDIQTWKDWERLLGLCSFVVLSRQGHAFTDLVNLPFMKTSKQKLEVLDSGEQARIKAETAAGMSLWLEQVPLYDISSTDIRKRIRQGRSIKYLLPDAVETYILDNTLYA